MSVHKNTTITLLIALLAMLPSIQAQDNRKKDTVNIVGLKAAAAGGDVEAQLRLGILYSTGEGVDKDPWSPTGGSMRQRDSVWRVSLRLDRMHVFPQAPTGSAKANRAASCHSLTSRTNVLDDKHFPAKAEQ